MKLLDINEASTLLGVNISWMRKAIREKQIVYYKIGKYIKFKEQDLIDFVEQAKVEVSQNDEKVIDIFSNSRFYEKNIDY